MTGTTRAVLFWVNFAHDQLNASPTLNFDLGGCAPYPGCE
jgi:hypothetical protein